MLSKTKNGINLVQIHLTALDLAQLYYHDKIVELLSHANQNSLASPTFRETR